MRILISGTSGFLGEHLVRFLSQQEGLDLFALDRAHFSPTHDCVSEVFLSHVGEIQRAVSTSSKMRLAEVEIDAILHCAAMSSFSGCQEVPEEAERANVHYTQEIVELAHQKDAYLIFFSTDLVYDGNAPAPYGGFREEVLPVPLSVYSKTKYSAEHCVAEQRGDRSLILRTSLLYGRPAGRSGGALQWMIDAVDRGEPLSAFSDEWRTPLYVGDLVRIVGLSLQAQPTGLFHCGGPERLSRLAFMNCFVVSYSDTHGSDLLQSVSRDTAPFPHRPEDVSLCSLPLFDTLRFRPRSVVEGLHETFVGQ
jgi:dTDP-4-dehydrorhamnose reductase